MRRAQALAWTGVALVTAILLWHFQRDASTPSLGTLLFWITLLGLGEMLAVSLGFETEVTMAFPIHLALAIVFSTPVAMLIAGLGAFDLREVRRQIPLWLALWNRAQMMLAVGAASAVISLSPDDRLTVLSVVGGALAHLVVNLGLVATMVNLTRQVSVREAIRSLLPTPMTGFWISYILLTALGATIAVAYREIAQRELAVIALFIPLLFARLSILGARAQQELSEKIQKQQQALLEATEKIFAEREAERNRIAEYIHDSSLQMLAAASYGCGNAVEFIKAGRQERAEEIITTARDALDGAMSGLRDSLVDLRKSSIEAGGLMETVHTFADQASTLWGTQVYIEGGVSKEPPISVALAGFQILQEGLVNAMKHADGGVVTVKISDKDGMIHIVVEDQGKGFDLSAEVGADHQGMRLMKERAARVGGRIELDSQPGEGTRVEAILPGGVAQ